MFLVHIRCIVNIPIIQNFGLPLRNGPLFHIETIFDNWYRLSHAFFWAFIRWGFNSLVFIILSAVHIFLLAFKWGDRYLLSAKISGWKLLFFSWWGAFSSIFRTFIWFLLGKRDFLFFLLKVSGKLVFHLFEIKLKYFW